MYKTEARLRPRFSRSGVRRAQSREPSIEVVLQDGADRFFVSVREVSGEERAAWFSDSEGNIFAVSQPSSEMWEQAMRMRKSMSAGG